MRVFSACFSDKNYVTHYTLTYNKVTTCAKTDKNAFYNSKRQVVGNNFHEGIDVRALALMREVARFWL